jgi:hypothetical protein
MPVKASERAYWEMKFFAGLRVEEWSGMCECMVWRVSLARKVAAIDGLVSRP